MSFPFDVACHTASIVLEHSSSLNHISSNLKGLLPETIGLSVGLIHNALWSDPI